MSGFKRRALIVGQSFIHTPRNQEGSIIARKEGVEVSIKIDSTQTLKDFAKALSDAWKDHVSLKGELFNAADFIEKEEAAEEPAKEAADNGDQKPIPETPPQDSSSSDSSSSS